MLRFRRNNDNVSLVITDESITSKKMALYVAIMSDFGVFGNQDRFATGITDYY